MASRVGIDAGRRFVEEDDLGITDERHADGQLAPLAARQFGRPRVALGRQVDVAQRLLHLGLQLIVGDAADATEEGQVLARRQHVEEHVVLRADARHPLDVEPLVRVPVTPDT